MWTKKAADNWKAVSVDFDDTIVEKVKFPAIGTEKPGARELLNGFRKRDGK